MNNTQLLYFAILVPTFTVVIGILVNLWNSNRIEHNLGARLDRQATRFDKQDGRFDRLEDRLNAIHDVLIGKVIEHGERISKLEHK